MITFRRVTPAELSTVRDRILTTYREAFRVPRSPDGDKRVVQFGTNQLDRHSTRPGFRCCVAFRDSTFVGFAYGYTGGPGMWWYDTVTTAMSPETIDEWLSDYFEFAELAVAPKAQRQGIGMRLHNMLLDELPHRTAALSVAQGNEPAAALYRKQGWTPIVENFRRFNKPYMIMGKKLKSKNGQPSYDT